MALTRGIDSSKRAKKVKIRNFHASLMKGFSSFKSCLTLPMIWALMPAFCKASRANSAFWGGKAHKSPPEVCGSKKAMLSMLCGFAFWVLVGEFWLEFLGKLAFWLKFVEFLPEFCVAF